MGALRQATRQRPSPRVLGSHIALQHEHWWRPDARCLPGARWRISTVGSSSNRLTKLVTLSVKPLEKAEDAVTGGEHADGRHIPRGDATGVSGPDDRAVRSLSKRSRPSSRRSRSRTRRPGWHGSKPYTDPEAEAQRQEGQPSRRSQGATRSSPRPTITDGSSAAPQSGLRTKAIKKFDRWIRQPSEGSKGAGTGAAAADHGGGETGGGDAG